MRTTSAPVSRKTAGIRCLIATAATFLVSLSCSTFPLIADTAAGLRAFRQQDYATAAREWQAAAAQGDKDAQYNLGLLYLKGLGVRTNATEAFRLLRAAAMQGQVNAQFQVGQMREKGH